MFCGAGVVHKPQLGKSSTPCGVVSTREKSVFVPDLLALMGYGRIYGTAMGPYPHWVRRNTPRPFAGLSSRMVPLALRAAHPLNDEPMSILAYYRHHRAALCRPAGEIGYRPRFVRISETGIGLYILPWWRCPYVRAPANQR